MNIFEFSKIFQNLPVFSLRDIEKQYPDFEQENLLNWQKRGFLLRIRNGWYSLTDEIQTLEQAWFAANKIYAPSYISLESALAHYGWIPEGVFTITSVSTRKTNIFDTPKGRFRYTSIKPSLFFGYHIIPVDGRGVKMADPEKTLLDFLYFHPSIREEADFESYRFNLNRMRTDLNWEKIVDYNSLFASPALSKRLKVFKNILNHVEYF